MAPAPAVIFWNTFPVWTVPVLAHLGLRRHHRETSIVTHCVTASSDVPFRSHRDVLVAIMERSAGRHRWRRPEGSCESLGLLFGSVGTCVKIPSVLSKLDRVNFSEVSVVP